MELGLASYQVVGATCVGRRVTGRKITLSLCLIKYDVMKTYPLLLIMLNTMKIFGGMEYTSTHP